MRFVVSAVRFAYDGRPISNTRPMLNWLNGLGEGPYGHQTPDGYPLTELNWASSGQMSRRFEIARADRLGQRRVVRSGGRRAPRPPPAFRSCRTDCTSRRSSRSWRRSTKDALNRAPIRSRSGTRSCSSSPDFNYE